MSLPDYLDLIEPCEEDLSGGPSSPRTITRPSLSPIDDVAAALGHINDVPTGPHHCQWLGWKDDLECKNFDVLAPAEPKSEQHVRAQLWLRLVGILSWSCEKSDDWKRTYRNRLHVGGNLCDLLLGRCDAYQTGYKTPDEMNPRPSWVIVPTRNTLLDAISVVEMFCSLEECRLLEAWPEEGLLPDWKPHTPWALSSWGRHMTVRNRNIDIFQYEIVYCQDPDKLNHKAAKGIGMLALESNRPTWPIALVPPLPTRWAPLNLVAVTIRAVLRLQRPEEDGCWDFRSDTAAKPKHPPFTPEFASQFTLMSYFLNLYDQQKPTKWREERPHELLPFAAPDPPCERDLAKLDLVRRTWHRPAVDPADVVKLDGFGWDPPCANLQQLVDAVGTKSAKNIDAPRLIRTNQYSQYPKAGDFIVAPLLRGLPHVLTKYQGDMLARHEEHDDENATPTPSPPLTPKPKSRCI